MSRTGSDVGSICARARRRATLTEPDIERLLAAEGEDRDLLFSTARDLRREEFGDRVFLYGFIYFSTHCRNECVFCFYRAGNRESPRYRKSPEEITDICLGLAESGVVLLDLTMGEDPKVFAEPGLDSLLGLVSRVRESSGLPIMVSAGLVPDEVMAGLAGRGAEWYALYQETHTPELFSRLRTGQSFAARAAARSAAGRAGLLVEDGILTGVGDTAADRARSIAAMRDAGCQQVRVMTFVPQAGTPLAGATSRGDADELRAIAAMRVAMPERLIPASLDVDGIGGLERRLDAGANVVTSIVPPTVGLAGVSNAELDIDEGYRTVAGVLPHLDRLGLRSASPEDYRAWVESARQRASATAP